MGGWLLGSSAGAFWAGILLSGAGSKPLGVAPSALMMLAGSAGLYSLVSVLRPGQAVPRTPPAGGSGPSRSRIRWVPGLAVAGGFVLLGAGWGGVHDARVQGSALARLRGRTVEMWATLSSDPSAGTLGWTATLQVQAVFASTPGSSSGLAVSGRVWAEGHGPPPRLDAGERVWVEGLLEDARGSFGVYLRHRGYAGTMSVAELRPRGPPTNPLLRAADSLRSALARSLRAVFPSREAGLMMGLTLGDTSRLDPIVAEQFRATGLTHLLAVSGENVAMFMAPILALAGLLRMGRRGRFALGLFAIAFFALLTRAEPSVLRASAMAGLTLLGVFLGRPRTAPAIMGGALLLLLAMDPTLIYAIGFQLSVAATAGMALLAGPLSERLRFLPQPFAMASGTTLAAQAGVTPLLLHYFGTVPTVTLAANVLAFPAVGPGMLLGLVAAAVGLLSHPLGATIAAMARIPLGYLEGLAARLARAPLPTITASGGRRAQLVFGFGLVAAAGWWIRSGARLPRRAALALGLALAVFTWSSALAAGPPRALTVVFFDVGQGDAALIRSPGGAAILIDGGPKPDLVATDLAALGVHRLDLMVATHPHADHVAGLPAVLARVPVALVVDPGCRGASPYYAQFLRAVAGSGAAFRHPRPGAVLRVGDVRLEVLGPERCFKGTNSDPNNDSMVLRISDGSASIMFPGDAEQPAQTDVVRDERALLVATVLKVPHHGGATSLDAFFKAVGARVAVVSVGPNLYGHPVPAVLAELARDGMRVFRTDRSGDITVTFQGGSVSVQSSHA